MQKMASAITTTRRTDRRRLAARARSTAGFSLTEVIIVATLSAFIMAGVMTSFLALGRNGYNTVNYCIMESDARRALERFAQDARMASDIAWSGSDPDSTNSITLTVLTGTSSTVSVTYAYDSSTTGTTAKCFYRREGTGTPLILARNVEAFAFRRYKLQNATEYPAKNNTETKQIQLTLRCVRTGVTVVDATNALLSARVVLRNKKVTA